MQDRQEDKQEGETSKDSKVLKKGIKSLKRILGDVEEGKKGFFTIDRHCRKAPFKPFGKAMIGLTRGSEEDWSRKSEGWKRKQEKPQ